MQNFSLKIAIFLKSTTFKQFLLYFLSINKSSQFNDLKTRAAMDAKISVFVIYVEAIIYLLLHNLHDSTFKGCFLNNSSNEHAH